MRTKESFKNQLKDFFGDTIYYRGLDYYQHGLMDDIKISDRGRNIIQITGKVEGTRIYESLINFDMESLSFIDSDCNCPYGADCKHSVVLGLYFIDIFYPYLRDDKFSSSLNPKERKNVFLDLCEIMQNESKTKRKEDAEIMKKLQSIGIDTKNVSDSVVNELKASLKKPEAKQSKKAEFNINNYYIILNIEHNWTGISLCSRTSKYNFYNNIADKILKKHKNELSKAEREFFNIIDNSGYSSASNGRFFELIYETGIGLYKNSYLSRNKMVFDVNPPKIKAKLLFKEEVNKYWDCEQNSFIFSLDEKYYNQANFIHGRDYFIEFVSKKINFHPIFSVELLNIILRIEIKKTGYEYYDNNLLKTKLTEDEILKINDIISNAKKYFDFETNIPNGFEMIESKKSEPKILIDYNSTENSLKVFLIVDYGFEKVDVSETVYYSNSRANPSLKRRQDYKFWENYIISIQKNKMFFAKINEKKEIDIYRKIYESQGYYGFTKTVKYYIKSKDKINDFFNIYLPRIKEFGYSLEYVNEKIDFEIKDFKADFKIDLNAENNWLHFDVDCYCGDDKINIDDLKGYIKNDKDFLKLKDGKMLRVANRTELEKFIFMLQSFNAREKGGFEGKIYHAGELQNIISESKYYNSHIASGFKKFLKEAEKGKAVKKIKLPAKINNVMRKYQKEGIDWFYFLRKYRFAGVLADDMGTGKTLQALALLEKEKVKNKPSITVCPKSLIYNWQHEAEKFTPKLKTAVIDGLPEVREKFIKNYKKYDLLITSYFTFRNDFDIYEKQKIKFNYFVLDEAQGIKNYKTKIAKTVKKLDADYRLALTGTPLENNVSEVWSIFDFLMPGFLGTDKQFRQKFQNPIMKENDVEALNLLRQKVKPFMLRRIKGDVLKELPPKQEQISYCQLGDEQRILYQEILTKIKSELFDVVKEKGFSKSQIHILAALTKLRQVCNHPVLLLKDKNYKKYKSAKLDLFLNLVNEIVNSGRKVLVFSQFTTMLDILAKELERGKIEYSYLSGKTKKRQELVDDFNSSATTNVFLISLKAGGTGLNLTSADNVIIFDPWWNPSVENQAIDRTHRIGQKNSVNVYRLITKGTIEEKIVELQNRKKLLFDNMIEASGATFKKLTWDDIRGLLE